MKRRLPLFVDALASRRMPATLSALAADFRDESFLECAEALGYDRDYSRAAWSEVTAFKALCAIERAFAHRSVIYLPDHEQAAVPEIDMVAARKKWIDLRSLKKPQPPPATGLCAALLGREWRVCVLTKSGDLLNLEPADRSTQFLEYSGLFDRWYQNRQHLKRIRSEPRLPDRPVDVVIVNRVPRPAQGLPQLPMAKDVLVLAMGYVRRAVAFRDFVTDGPRAWDKASELVDEHPNDLTLTRLRLLSGDANPNICAVCPTRAEISLFDISHPAPSQLWNPVLTAVSEETEAVALLGFWANGAELLQNMEALARSEASVKPADHRHETPRY